LAYFKTFGVKATISRCTNNYGEWQHPEKLIPKTITNAINNIKIPIYGDGKQVRNWIHVNDHCEGILDILYGGKIG
jgi:dTDP-glucose 4,6-dehydratase